MSTPAVLPKVRVVIKDHCIVFPAAGDYSIELAKLNTPEKILSWTLHLAKKSWMDASLLEHFVATAARYHSISIPDTV